MAVFFTEVGDVGAGCLEHAQAQQPEQADQREVVGVAGVAAGGEQGFELQMGQAEGG